MWVFVVIFIVVNFVLFKFGVLVGDWCDSNDGLGGGCYVYDVNVIFIFVVFDVVSVLYCSGLFVLYVSKQDQVMFVSFVYVVVVWCDKVFVLFIVIVDSVVVWQVIIVYVKVMSVLDVVVFQVIGDQFVQFQVLLLDVSGQLICVQNSDGGFVLLFGKFSFV